MYSTKLVIFTITFCGLCVAEIFSLKHICPKLCVCDIHNSLRRAACNHINIIDIDMGVPENVEIYNLNGNSIQQLDDHCFMNMGYQSLIQLDLSNNMIFWIGLHALAGVEKLEYLNLSNNRLESLPPDLFWYNQHLKILDLSKNKFLSVENKPFLSHSNLKMLNLSHCQIPSLGETVFTELPSLTDLDLSKNYMIELRVSVLKPLMKLKYINLDENQWHCNGVFNDLQVWILTNKIEYITQCMMKDKQKKFEKMISLVPVEVEKTENFNNQNLDELWDIKSDNELNTTNGPILNTPLSFIDKFNLKFPSLWSLVIGFQVGVLFGMLITYCWMAQLCKGRNMLWKRRRQIIRERNISNAEDHLLWNTSMRIQANTETPPIIRRQLSSPNAFYRSNSWEAACFPSSSQPVHRDTGNAPVRSTRILNGYETPPPPYREVIHDRVISHS